MSSQRPRCPFCHDANFSRNYTLFRHIEDYHPQSESVRKYFVRLAVESSANNQEENDLEANNRASLDLVIEKFTNEMRILKEGIILYSDHFQEQVLVVGCLYQFSGDSVARNVALGMKQPTGLTKKPCLHCEVTNPDLETGYPNPFPTAYRCLN